METTTAVETKPAVKPEVTITEKLGNFPVDRVTIYGKDFPGHQPKHGQLVGLRYKLDKKENTKRANMAIDTVVYDADNFNSVSLHKFLNSLIADVQRDALYAVADGLIGLEVAEDADKLVAWYYDDSRGSNKINKDDVIAYVVESFGLELAKAILTKNAQMSEETVKKTIQGYAEMFGKFTKYNLAEAFQPHQVTLCKKVLDMNRATCASDDMFVWIESRIKKL